MGQEQERASKETTPEASRDATNIDATNIKVTEPQQTPQESDRAQRSALATSEWSNPFTAMRKLMDDVNRFFSGFGFGMPSIFGPTSPFEMVPRGLWVPAIETFERDGKLVLCTDLPGLRREDVQVEVLGDELVISGERKQEEEETRGGRQYSERRYGSFERRITLPVGIEASNIEASFENGVLEVSLTVPPGRESRKIEVKSGTQTREEEESGGRPESIH